MRISDQAAAIKLAICDDIGERSYDATDVAAILVQMLAKLPTVGKHFVSSSLDIVVNLFQLPEEIFPIEKVLTQIIENDPRMKVLVFGEQKGKGNCSSTLSCLFSECSTVQHR